MRPAVFVVLLFASVAAFAQVEQATVTGTVTDQSGAVIPGARVVVRNIRTSVETATQSNTEGYYSVPYLHPGEYEVTVEREGFKKARVAGVNLTVGLIATINVSLELGTVQNEVTVTSAAVYLEQQSASLGSVIGSSQMLELPLLGRNPYGLALLAPAVLPKGGAGAGPIISGGRSNTSEILLDGAETRNSTTNDINYTPPLEAVQEFKVITNSFSAEYGRSGAGVLTAATRSGTNELHGSLYEFLRNDKLNANSWLSNRQGLKKGAFRRNEYGFAVGGPVYLPGIYKGRDRTFFFINLERVPQRNPDDINTTVPTALERAGDFSQTADGGGNLIRIYDPDSTRPDPARAGRFTRDAFPQNRIPAARIHPMARKILEYYPLPNRSTRTQNFALNGSRKDDTRKLFLRFDHNLGTRHRLFFSHGRSNQDRNTPGVNPAFPTEGTNGEKGLISNAPRSAVLSDTVTFRPNLIGEFRASMSRNVITTRPRSAGFNLAELGFAPEVVARVKTPVFPYITVGDVTSLGPDRASFFNDAENTAEGQGHMTWLRGSHSLKTGFDYTFQAFNVVRPERPAGTFDFNRTFTQGPDPATSSGTAGFGAATLLLGAPTGGQISADPSLAASQKYYAWYLQDDWKLRRNLTLNLGIRWEYQSPWTDRFDQLAYFDPDAVDPVSRQKGVLRFVGRDGNPRTQSNPDRNNFGPRAGLAWQFARNTVVRAGYALFYSPGSGGIGAGASDLGSGFLAQTNIFLGPPVAAPNTPPPGASLVNPFQAGFFDPPTTGVGGSVNTAFRDWVTPYSQQWNANLQRTLRNDLLVEVAYIGSRSQRIWVNRSRTAVSTEYLSLGPALDEIVPNPYYGIIKTGARSSPTLRRSDLLQPFNHYSGVSRFRDPVGDSVYHGFTLRVDKKMTHGLNLQVSYTVSKEIDNAQERFSGRSNFIDPNNLARSRSIGDYDRPQYLVINYVYELPAAGGWTGRLLGRWQVSGVTTLGKGLPLVITAPSNTRLPGVSATALRLKSPLLPESQRNLDRWFDTSAFAAPPTFSLGSDSRTQPNLRGPGMKTFDIGISRVQRIRERVNVQFRGEFFNAFNTPQFGEPNGSVNSRDFGRILSAGGARSIQLGIRVSF